MLVGHVAVNEIEHELEDMKHTHIQFVSCQKCDWSLQHMAHYVMFHVSFVNFFESSTIFVPLAKENLLRISHTHLTHCVNENIYWDIYICFYF